MKFKSKFYYSNNGILRPFYVEITDRNVFISRRNENLFSMKEMSIPLEKVAGVALKVNLFSTDIVIYGNSSKLTERVYGFSKNDAQTIKSMLTK